MRSASTSHSSLSTAALLASLVAVQAWGWIGLSRAVEGKPNSAPTEGLARVGAPARVLERTSASPPPGRYATDPPLGQGQGERMLRDPRSRRPAFIPEPERKPGLFMAGACKSRLGAVNLSYANPDGYARCLEEGYPLGARAVGMGAWF